MFDKNLTKPKLTFLVNKQESLKIADSLTDSATGAVDLLDGQIGILNSSPSASGAAGKIPLGTFFNPATSTNQVPEIKLVQGTSTSANPPVDLRPGVKRPYESSAKIQGDEKVWISVKKAKAASYSIWGVSNINVEDSTEYRMRIAYRGRWHDMMYSDGSVSTPVYAPYYTTPDYTQLIADGTITGAGESLDHLIKNLVAETNKNSAAFSLPQINKGGTQLLVALAIGDGAASGTITVDANNTTITSVTVGSVTLTEGTEFDIGGSATLTAADIVDAINGDATLTALGVVASNAAGVITVQAPGASANSIALSAIGADISVSGATLTGGFGVGISTLSPSTVVPVFSYTGPNGVVTKSYTFNAEQIVSLQTAYSGLETIVLADSSSIQDVAQVDKFALVALDRPLFPAEDRMTDTKVTLDLGLPYGFDFNSVVSSQLSKASEGEGYPRQILHWYEETQQRRDNDIKFRGVGIQKIEYPSDILDISVPQDTVVITHSTTKQGAIGMRDVNLQATVIFTAASVNSEGVPTGNLGTLTADVPDAVEAWGTNNNVKVVRNDA